MSPEFRELNSEDEENIKDALAILTDGNPDEYFSPTRIGDKIVRGLRGGFIPPDCVREYLDSLPEKNVESSGSKDRPTYRMVKEWV